MLRRAKEALEKMTGSRIYRNSLPHGVDYCADIARAFGSTNVRVVFDVGANAGQSAITYVQKFPRAEIYSFEPVAATYSKLVSETRKFGQIHTVNCGMSNEIGNAVINVNPVDRMSSIGIRRPGDSPETISLDTITNFVAEQQLQTIDFLKIDTECHDLEVLRGAAPLLDQKRIHLVLTECEPIARSGAFVSFAAMADYLQEFGYRLFGVYEQQPEWDGSHALLFWNALFISEKLVPVASRLA